MRKEHIFINVCIVSLLLTLIPHCVSYLIIVIVFSIRLISSSDTSFLVLYEIYLKFLCLRRVLVGPIPHLGSTVVLTLLVGTLWTCPEVIRVGELTLYLLSATCWHGWGKGTPIPPHLTPCHLRCGRKLTLSLAGCGACMGEWTLHLAWAAQ